ncbi:hypothetical protein GF386_00825 [Candidatus Pacearchaeota archaeon]|nr:hypothetical protein [Candidatus Pacearchaeota archaeon]MBD3282801.1 hypothetical protein [Candidatus Pacearchaeota archaeon]
MFESKRERFVKDKLEDLLRDDEIREVLDNAEDSQKSLLEDRLRKDLEDSYDTYARQYYDSNGLNYLATALRTLGNVSNVLGTASAAYGIWALGPAGLVASVPAYFGFKRLGLALTMGAEGIDSYRLAKSGKGLTEKVKDQARVHAEGIPEKAIAYYLPGGEVLDIWRGRRKFNAKADNRAKYHAKTNFLSYVNDALKIVPLGYLKNREYGETDEEPAVLSMHSETDGNTVRKAA